MRLLLVEDDLMVGESIRAGLKKHGFAARLGYHRYRRRSRLAAHSHDLVLLDLGLPGKSGIEVLRRLRGAGDNIPVLIITARDAVTIEFWDSTAEQTTLGKALRSWRACGARARTRSPPQ